MGALFLTSEVTRQCAILMAQYEPPKPLQVELERGCSSQRPTHRGEATAFAPAFRVAFEG